jgi:hypothetical protein
LLAAVVLNVAVTDSAASIVTEQLATPVHAPVQPANVEPEFGTWASATDVPLAKLAAHVPGHAIPAGVLVTVPPPDPAMVTVSVKFAGGGGGVVLPDELQATRLTTPKRRRTIFTASQS